MNELQVNVGSILEELKKKKDYKKKRIVLIVSTNFPVSLKDYSIEVCFPTWEKEIFTPTPALHTKGSSTSKLSWSWVIYRQQQQNPKRKIKYRRVHFKKWSFQGLNYRNNLFLNEEKKLYHYKSLLGQV